MSKERGARSKERPGADAPGPGAPVEEAEVVDAEVVEDAEVEDAELVDAEVVEEESSHGSADEDAPVDGAAAEEVAPDSLADALRERDEYLGLAQRARADFENYKRRTATQAAEAEQRGRAAIARALLPAIDNLERALAAAGADPRNGGDGPEGGDMAKGFALVYGELRSALERSGVNAFDPVGTEFDPNVHEAISTAPAEGAEPGTVIETLELGYSVEGQVIRPARVIVSG